MQIQQMMNRLSIKFLINFLGLFITIIFVWLRFLRERLPLAIPYQMSLVGFFIITFIILTYIFLVFSNLLNYSFIRHKWFENGISFLYQPLISLHEFIKNQKFINPYYNSIILFLFDFAKLLINMRIAKKDKYFGIIIWIMQLFPRLILVLTLGLDIYYNHKFSLFYQAITITIIILINNYIIYILKTVKEQKIQELELMAEYISSDYDDPEDHDEDEIFGTVKAYPVRKIIEEQTKSLVYYNKDLKPYPRITREYSDERRKLYKVQKPIVSMTMGELIKYSEFINAEAKELLSKILVFSIFLEEYKYHSEFVIFKQIKHYINTLFLIYWSNILLLNLNVQDIIEPFSGLYL